MGFSAAGVRRSSFDIHFIIKIIIISVVCRQRRRRTYFTSQLVFVAAAVVVVTVCGCVFFSTYFSVFFFCHRRLMYVIAAISTYIKILLEALADACAIAEPPFSLSYDRTNTFVLCE